jgi:hypothetical protein
LTVKYSSQRTLKNYLGPAHTRLAFSPGHQYLKKKKKKNSPGARGQWLMLIILDTQEAEIRRLSAPGQLGK